MKNQIKTLAIILFLMEGLTGCNQSVTQDEFITIDVTADYPEKELILQDFMDVEYIPLGTDSFVTQAGVLAIGNKYILTRNWSRDGDIFVFDRNTGKGIRKINRMGRGPEEYEMISRVVLDEDNDELFVNCPISKKLFVYDLLGNYKRSFEYTEGSSYSEIFNYDSDNLIRYDGSGYEKNGENRGDQSFHAIISKQDGSITRNIFIPFDVIKAPVIQEGDILAVFAVSSIIPYFDNWLLVDTSTDTVYNYRSGENELTPFLVKTPTADSEIILTMGTVTDRYYFMKSQKKEFNSSTMKMPPPTDLVYDRQENAVYEPVVLNGDFTNEYEVDMTSYPVNGEIASYQNIDAYELVEAYNNDELTGELKEIAADLEEGSNPVIMLVKYKD